MWKATAGQGPKSGHQESASYRCTEIYYMCIYPLGFRGAFGADHINQPKIAHTYLPLCGTMKSRAALFLFFFLPRVLWLRVLRIGLLCQRRGSFKSCMCMLIMGLLRKGNCSCCPKNRVVKLI